MQSRRDHRLDAFDDFLRGGGHGRRKAEAELDRLRLDQQHGDVGGKVFAEDSASRVQRVIPAKIVQVEGRVVRLLEVRRPGTSKIAPGGEPERQASTMISDSAAARGEHRRHAVRSRIEQPHLRRAAQDRARPQRADDRGPDAVVASIGIAASDDRDHLVRADLRSRVKHATTCNTIPDRREC